MRFIAVVFLSAYLILTGLVSCKSGSPTLFREKSAKETGLAFANVLTDTEQENILAYEYYYNGGGIGVADFNNDSLPDVFATGNQVGNALYLNKGNWQFEDITAVAGIRKPAGSWATGVAVGDVNADGRVDIYVCYSGNKPNSLRKNQLYLNKGTHNGQLQFEEVAEKVGLADTGYSTTAGFLDFDLDGDLDLFLVNHNLRNYQRKESAAMRTVRDANAGDKLYENRNGQFIDISEKAGIKGSPMGFGLGLGIADVNKDGYPDIYVTNDYVEDDYLYINQRNGTFEDELRSYLTQTSQFSMGVELADLTNDGLLDIYTLDMLPEDNKRQKQLIWPDNWTIYQAQLKAGFWHQNMRNMLHIAAGSSSIFSTTSTLHFSELGQQWGVANTDWSWSALAADFDADGYKDLFVTNGIGKDYTDADFVKYYYDDKASRHLHTTLLDDLKQMPSTPTKHYIFRNEKSGGFSNHQQAWGFDKESVASGAAYADFDNDGDIDLITNRLNNSLGVYENTLSQKNLLKISLEGSGSNKFGVGAKLTIYANGQQQYVDYSATHGFQSSTLVPVLVGLGTASFADSVIVKWPSGKEQHLGKIASNSLTLREQNATQPTVYQPYTSLATFDTLGYQHQPLPINNFDVQPLLLKFYTANGPRMATGDVDGDGRPDVFICGTTAKAGELQLATGRKQLFSDKNQQDAALLDADADGDLDLYIVCGGYTDFAGSSNLQDELWLNNGHGHFSAGTLPQETYSGSFVKVLDVNADRRPDLLVGGGVEPNRFPMAHPTFLLINQGGQFSKAELGNFGITTDAAVLDFSNDGLPDVAIAGEFMPLLLLKNEKTQLGKPEPLSHSSGWWTRLLAADIDADGDLDLVAGNGGQNTQWQPTAEQPLQLHHGDADQNGQPDPILSYFVQGQAYPAMGRDNLLEQLPFLRKHYTHYAPYAQETRDGLLAKLPPGSMQKLEITETRSGVFVNTNGNFQFEPLPAAAQWAPVYAWWWGKIGGRPMLLAAGNNSYYRLRFGRMAANRLQAFERTTQGWRYAGAAGLPGDVRDIQPLGNELLIARHGESVVRMKLSDISK